MPRTSKTLTLAAQAAFVADLEGGALVAEAARRVGVAVSSLYCRRGRDPLFAAAWEYAVWRSALPGRTVATGGKRRVRFAARRRATFLAALERDCDTKAAAAAAGVDKTTVHRRIARDPAFAADNDAALARGYAGLEAALARERALEPANAARLFDAIEPKGAPTRDFDKAMKLLARWDRPDGSIGPRFVRHGRMKRWTFEEAIWALDRKLRALGVRRAKAPEGPTPSTGIPAG